MKILATVNYGKAQITQAWEFITGGSSPSLVISRQQDGSLLVVRLDKTQVQDLKGHELAEKVYVGAANTSDAVILKQA